MHKGRFKNVAFFSTCGGSGGRRAFRQMIEICGTRPLDVLDLRHAEVKRGEHTKRVQAFVATVADGRAAA